jgi:hypothetical protein
MERRDAGRLVALDEEHGHARRTLAVERGAERGGALALRREQDAVGALERGVVVRELVAEDERRAAHWPAIAR